jgi:hypothetical protein
VLKAYFDDSGTHDSSSVVVIAGCVAREQQWALFEQEWAAMLEHFGIKEYHSTDLQAFVGEFKGSTEPKRRELVAWATKIGKTWAKNSFASLVVRDYYSRAIPDWAKQSVAFGDEYNFCFQMSVGQVMDWINYLKPPMPTDDQVAFMFDQQPKREGISNNTYAAIKKFRDPHDRMGTFGFGSSERFLPLQFADFIAYESYKELDRQVTVSPRQIRTSFQILIGNDYQLQGRYFDLKGLEALVKSYDQRGRPANCEQPWWPWVWPRME